MLNRATNVRNRNKTKEVANKFYRKEGTKELGSHDRDGLPALA